MQIRLFLILCTLFTCKCQIENGSELVAFYDTVSESEFILIKGGIFLMGSHENHGKSEPELLHEVSISKDFWLSKTEVTQYQWQKIMGKEELHPEKPSPFRNTNPDYPVVSVSYYDVQTFLQKINKLSKNYTYRLPTEAEWEYACRAGTTSPFSYGKTLSDSFANYRADIESEYSTQGMQVGHPQPVGTYPPNRWGLYDMHGNVWEWVGDWYAPYSKTPVSDPEGPINGKEKVIRGGSWYFGAKNAKSSVRKTHAPKLWGFSIGFRLAGEKRELSGL